VAGSSQANIAVATPTFAKRKARALVGWLTEDEGALWLAGRDPQAAADPAIRQRCAHAHGTVAGRPPIGAPAGILSPLPRALTAHAAALAGHPWGAQILADSGQPMIVDLRQVRAMQPTVHIEDARKRVEGIDPQDLVALAGITIPVPPARLDDPQVIFDHAKQAYILASPNPNLKVFANLTMRAPVLPGVDIPVVGFGVAQLPSLMSIAGIGGRYFLRDGYHRAIGLLAAGITHVPALVRDFNQVQEVRGIPPLGMLSPDVFLGDRPPFLPDYLDDAVAADTLAPIVTKMIVIQALEVTPLG
jgi:hypothetical protein